MNKFDEIIHPDEPEVDDRFVVDSTDKADWAIGKAVSAMEDIATLQKTRTEYIDRIESWFSAAVKPLESKIEFMTGLVQPWAEMEIGDGKKRSIALPSGVAGMRKLSPGIEVVDEAKALAECKASHPEAVKESLKKSELNRLMKAGELVSGCTITPGGQNFYIKGATK